MCGTTARPYIIAPRARVGMWFRVKQERGIVVRKRQECVRLVQFSVMVKCFGEGGNEGVLWFAARLTLDTESPYTLETLWVESVVLCYDSRQTQH